MGSFLPDDWLTRQIGKPAFRLQDLPPGVFPPGPCFCHAKVAPGDTERERGLEKAGFFRVETLRTYQKYSRLAGSADPRIRPARGEDRLSVEQVAGRSFQFSRFHLDPRFGPAAGNRIKAAWVGNFFEGQRGDHLWVLEERNRLAGFVLLFEGPEGVTVDLIAVDPAFRGQGLGQALLRASEIPGKRIQAGTQEANRPSCRLYERSGYTVCKEEHVYHFHG